MKNLNSLLSLIILSSIIYSHNILASKPKSSKRKPGASSSEPASKKHKHGEGKDEVKMVSLHTAVANHNLPLFIELIKRGIPFDSENDGKTPLDIARENKALEGEEEVTEINRQTIKRLLETYTRLFENMKTHDSYNEITEALQDDFFYIDVRNSFGRTLVANAAFHQYTESLKLLLKKPEASLISQDNKGNTALHLSLQAAYGADNRITVAILIATATNRNQKKFIDMQNKTEETALHCAADQGHLAAVSLLLRNGANRTIQNQHNHIPLQTAQWAKNRMWDAGPGIDEEERIKRAYAGMSDEERSKKADLERIINLLGE